MKRNILILAALTFACLCLPAMADDTTQMQEEQEACGTDVYTLCGDAIPDRDRITACLIKHHSEISAECRKAMRSHRRKARRDKKGSSGN